MFFSFFWQFESFHAQNVSAYDLINLINGMRSANGLGALSVDSALMACAQSTAETMAAIPGALHLRTLSTINDISSDQSNTIIFALPIEVLRAFDGMKKEDLKDIVKKVTK